MVDLVHQGPCLRSMDQRLLVHREPRSRPQSKTTAQWRPKAVTWQRHSMPRGGPKPSPYPGPTGPVWTRPVLTVDRSTLTVDLAPHVSGTDTLDPHVRC